MVATDCTTPQRIRLIRKWFQDHSRANIGLRTGIAFDVVDLDSEVAVDALEQPGPAGTSYEVLLLLLAADSIGTCCPLASATEPAFSPASTSVAEAATWSALRPFIQVVIVTAGSTDCSKSSLPRPVGSFSSSSQNVVQAAQNRPGGVQSLWPRSAAPRAPTSFPGKRRHSQPPTQYSFVQYGPASSRRSPLRARGRCCAHRARPAHRAWTDGV